MENFPNANEWSDKIEQDISEQNEQEQPTNIESKIEDENLEQRKEKFIMSFIERYERDLQSRYSNEKSGAETSDDFAGRSILINDKMYKYAKAKDEESERILRDDLEILKDPLTIEETYRDIADIFDNDVINYDEKPEGKDITEYAIEQKVNRRAIARAIGRIYLSDEAKMKYRRAKNFIRKQYEKHPDQDEYGEISIADFMFDPTVFKSELESNSL